MLHLLFAILQTLDLTILPGADPVTAYEVWAGPTPGNYQLAATVNTWATKPDGSRVISIANWDNVARRYVVVKGRNNFGAGDKSNEVLSGPPQGAPVVSNAAPGPTQ